MDLNRFDEVVANLDALAGDYSGNIGNNASYSDSVIFGSTKAQEYGKQNKEDQRVSIDLRHFAMRLKEKAATDQTTALADALIASIDRFVSYSKHDGSRPGSFGVSIAPPDFSSADHKAWLVGENWPNLVDAYAAIKSSDTQPPQVSEYDANADSSNYEWENDGYDDEKRANRRQVPFMMGDRAGLTAFDMSPGRNRNAGATAAGLSATFSDDHLAKVVTIFGFREMPFEGSQGTYFMSVGDLEAFKTTQPGQYFTPAWNQKWYFIQYGDSENEFEWMPLMFEGKYALQDAAHTVYTAEIDYYQAGKSYPDPEQSFGLAILYITVNDRNQVVDHSIRTYAVMYSSEEDMEGTVRIDKVSHKIAPGDKIQFWMYGFHSTDWEKDDWFEASDVLAFSREPVFTLEELGFENEKGEPVEFLYAMWAEDIAGNGVLTEPAAARTGELIAAAGEDTFGDTLK